MTVFAAALPVQYVGAQPFQTIFYLVLRQRRCINALHLRLIEITAAIPGNFSQKSWGYQ